MEPAKVKWEMSAGAVTLPTTKSESMNKTRLRSLDRGVLGTVGALTIAAVGLLAGGCDDDGKNRVTEEGAEGVATSGLAVSAPEEPLDNDKRRRLLRESLRAALGEHYDAPLPEATEDDLKKGAELWRLLCLGCHGHDAAGRRTLSRMLPTPPGNLTDPDRATYFSGQAKLWIVAEGSPGTPMFGWKEVLTEEDIRAVVAYLGTLMPTKQER